MCGKKRGLFIDLSLISNSNPLATPDGSVRFKRRLGSGSEGDVLMGESSRGEKVAVKVIHHDPQERLRALQSMWQRLRHPNIISHQKMQFDGMYGYVELELCETDLLKKIVGSPDGRLSESESFLLFYQLTRAVRHLHHLGIYHRDIKPENVLLKNRGLQVKLADFGTALVLPGPTTAYECSGFAPGSPLYLAPELLQLAQPGFCSNARVIDPGLADVWSLGATLFAMVAGRTPWSDAYCAGDEEAVRMDDEASRLLSARKEENLLFPAGLSDDVKDLLRGMLAVEPSRRLTLDCVWNHRWIKAYAHRFSSMASIPLLCRGETAPSPAGNTTIKA